MSMELFTQWLSLLVPHLLRKQFDHTFLFAKVSQLQNAKHAAQTDI